MIRVLIIDDDRLSLSGIRATLPWEHHQMKIVGEASNGKEGLAFLENHAVDLVMLDLAMPVMDGLTFIQRCREQHPEIQYVVMTFHENFAYIQEALRLGVIDYISKLKLEEEDLDSLMARIAETVRKRMDAPAEGLGTDNVQEIAEQLTDPLWLCDDLYFWETEKLICEKQYALSELETVLREALLRLELSGKFTVPEVGRLRTPDDARLYLKECRKQIAYLAAQGKPDTTEARLIHAASLINQRYSESFHIQEIADQSGLSRSYLSSCFSRYFGITLNEFTRRKKIYESMMMMIEGKKSLTDIALAVGYDSYQYYKKMFIETRGETPKEFRATCIMKASEEAK